MGDKAVGNISRNSKWHSLCAFFRLCRSLGRFFITDFTVLLAALRTDLSLLLECLKFQMKCPEMQKQALLAIHSICEKRGMWWQKHTTLCLPQGLTHALKFVFFLNIYFILVSEDAVDILKEMGGVAFVYNLSKSSIVHSDVKTTTLFTLGTLAEANGRQMCFMVA